MAINLSDISGFSKFVGTKFVEDISFGEEPLIDVKVMAKEYAGLKAEKAAKKAAAKKAGEAHATIYESDVVISADEEKRLEMIAARTERRKQTDAALKGSSPESDRY